MKKKKTKKIKVVVSKVKGFLGYKSKQ